MKHRPPSVGLTLGLAALVPIVAVLYASINQSEPPFRRFDIQVAVVADDLTLCRGKGLGTRACYNCCRENGLSASRCLRSCRLKQGVQRRYAVKKSLAGPYCSPLWLQHYREGVRNEPIG